MLFGVCCAVCGEGVLASVLVFVHMVVCMHLGANLSLYLANPG